MSESNHTPTLGIFLTNLKEYNNGSLVGQWVDLPVTTEEFHEALKDIGIGQKDEYGQVAEEYFVSDYDSVIPNISRLEDTGEYPDLNKLNQVAADYDNLSSWERDNLDALMETSYAPDTLNELGNLMNDSYALGDINIIPDGADDEKLAENYIDDVAELGQKTLENYFDYSAYGRDIKLDETGENIGWDYIEYGDVRLDNSEIEWDDNLNLDYEEETLPGLEPGMPADGILPGLPKMDDTLDLKLVNPKFVPDYYEYDLTDSTWISLPIERENYLQALCNIGIGNPPDGSENEEFQIAEVVSRIPGINQMNERKPFTQDDINDLNQVAMDYEALENYQQDLLDRFSETGDYPETLNELDHLIENEGEGYHYGSLNEVHLYENCASNSNYGQYWVDGAGMPANPEFYFDYESFGRDLRMDLTGEELDDGDFLEVGSDFSLDNDELYITEDLFDYEEEKELEEEREEEHPFSRREQFLKKLQPVKDLQNQNRLKEEEQKGKEPEPEVPKKEKPHD